jgi:DNA repair protein RecO (recombination protein O)
MPREIPKARRARDGEGGSLVSEIVKDRALMLKTFPYGESSVVAVALTRSHGKVRFLAKGARSPKSALQGSLMTGSVSDIVFYFRPERGLQLLKEIDTAGAFEAADGDFERLCLFQAGLEIIDCSVVERESDERVFDMIESFMRLLPGAADPWALFYALEINILKLAGSFPSTAACERCRRSLENEAFAVEAASGLVSCSACGTAKGRMLSRGAAALVARIDRLGLEGARGTKLSRGERREIGRLIHHFFETHVDGYRLPRALRLCKEVSGQ